MTALLFIIGVLALIGGLVWLSFHLEKKRTEAMRQACLRLGFAFSPKGDPALQNEMAAFQLFNQGHSRVLKNLIRGTGSDADIAIFDYRYTTGSGKNQHTRKQTVIGFRSAGLDLPAFSLSPENIMHKIGSVFGYQDIDFENYPGFSKRYLLRGLDETRIRMTFNDRVLRFFEQKHPICTEGLGNQFIFYRSSREVKTGDLNSFIAEGTEVLNTLRSGR